ncbi:hypothetical protein WKH15_03565 [Pantoea agglomerans]|uniref:hypothetical protein n=1 Tax=Enterobacter agglomerans TaxID=549 RepID=UPI003C7B3CD4
MSLSFNVKKNQRIDLWLKETKPASEALFTIRMESEVVFKIKMAPCYYSYFTWTAWQNGKVCLDWLPEHSEISLCFDAGIVDVFANENNVCGTRRYYSCIALTQKLLACDPAIVTHYRAAYAQQ